MTIPMHDIVITGFSTITAAGAAVLLDGIGAYDGLPVYC